MERQDRQLRRVAARQVREQAEARQDENDGASKKEDTATVGAREVATVVAGDRGTDDDRLKDYFLSQLKRGILPSVLQLRRWSQLENVALPRLSKLKSLRYNWKVSAMLSRWEGAKRYMGSSVAKLGTLQVDLAYFGKKYLVANGQNKYFLCGVDILTGKLSCVPTVSKTRQSWEKAILHMIKHSYEYISHIITDRDGAIVSKQFRKRLKLESGIGWSFLM